MPMTSPSNDPAPPHGTVMGHNVQLQAILQEAAELAKCRWDCVLRSRVGEYDSVLIRHEREDRRGDVLSFRAGRDALDPSWGHVVARELSFRVREHHEEQWRAGFDFDAGREQVLRGFTSDRIVPVRAGMTTGE